MTDSIRAAAEKLVQLLDAASETSGAPSDDECIACVEALNNLRTALAQPEEGELTDDELWQLGDEDFRANTWPTDAIRYARAVEAAVIARRPAPEPPADGEVGELSVVHATAPERIWLYLNGANEYLPFRNEDDVVWSPDPIDSSDIPYVRADLLVQRHPAPVPVSERLPGPKDCDGEGRCWWFCFECPGEHSYWILAKEVYCGPTYWLPFHALPLPAEGGK